MGSKKALKGTVSVMNIDGRIRLRWRYQSKRYSLNLFSFNKVNLVQARKIASAIEQDMTFDLFDSSLKKYKPEALQEQPKELKTWVQHFEEWVRNFRNMDCDRDIDYYAARNMMKRWGDFDVHSVVSHFNKETFGAKTYNRRLSLLQVYFKWAKKAKICLDNPLEDVLPKKTKKTPKKERKPFTEDEISRILDAVKNNTYCPKSSQFKHSHYYPFLYFVFKTGVRPAEAIGLRVQHLDFTLKRITIREVLARTIKGTNPSVRVRKETKNGKVRFLPMTDDLEELLKPLVAAKCHDDLVFKSQKGLAIDDGMFQRRVFSKVLEGLGIEHRVLYACRHTFNSRCIEAGMTPVMAAFLMGNNPDTALRNYTHQLSIPTELPKI